MKFTFAVALLLASTSGAHIKKDLHLAQTKSKAHAKSQTKATISAASKLRAYAKNRAGSCEDGPGVDSFGDGCDWYDANPSGCGGYDTADFTSAEECCICE